MNDDKTTAYTTPTHVSVEKCDWDKLKADLAAARSEIELFKEEVLHLAKAVDRHIATIVSMDARPALDRARLVEVLRQCDDVRRRCMDGAAERLADAILRHLSTQPLSEWQPVHPKPAQPAAEPAKPRRMQACKQVSYTGCSSCACIREHDENARCAVAAGCPACVPVAERSPK